MAQPELAHQALERVLRSIAGEPLVVLLSGHPDPDSIGSALAHQRICQHCGVPATIAHVQPVSLRENRALVKLLAIDLLQISSGAQLASFRHLSLVDTTTAEESLDVPVDLRLLTVVDHHRVPTLPSALFVDVRPTAGAASSMYAEYLQHGLAPLGGGQTGDSRVATALFFGIQTDSDDFALAQQADFLAAAYLKPLCDEEVLKRVGRRTVSAAAMNVLGQALAELVVVRDFAVAGVGIVDPGYRDAIAIAADFILRREDIDTVLVYGIVEDRIVGSLRTNNPSVDPPVFLRAAFGLDRQGKPYGGGRAEKGGFQIPLGFLAEVEGTDALWEIVEESVITHLARVIPDLRRPSKRGRPEAEPGPG
jgi:nanoRNase/pAp phosphatase (c-di-AMP/oligoRNAs hydrolase)